MPVRPPIGLIFESYSAPIQTNFDSTPIGSRVADSTIHHIRDPIFTGAPLITWGDASVATIAAGSGIDTVNFVDYRYLSVLGIYVQLEVVVSGD